MSYPTRAEARVVVGLDFGTTFSGFGYAHRSDPTEVCVHHEWPGFAEASGKPYCKTQTALYYKRTGGSWKLDAWGWQAQLNYTRDLDLVQRKKAGKDSVGEIVTRFKLHLADEKSGPLSAAPLPRGLTTQQVVTDFLREIGNFIMKHLNLKYGQHLTMDELQWCVTVPSIWGDKAKQQMKSFMQGAGLVGGAKGSPYPVVVVLEPEAAAVYCLKKLTSFKLYKGDKFLVADIGGGTSDIVVQEKANSTGNFKVKEVTASSGGLCGGSYVDQSFMKFMSSKIGCLENFLVEHPKVKIQLQTWWENAKSTFEGGNTDLDLTCPLSSKLAIAWEAHDTEQSHYSDYSEVEITDADMVQIFSGVVNDNIKLIRAQLEQTSNIKMIMVVGGFATSKYLMSKIKQAFERDGIVVVSPNEPGRAICDGAVSVGFFPDNLLSRVARRTYGIEYTPVFRSGVDPDHLAEYYDGVKRCTKKFDVFVSVGSTVETEFAVERSYYPVLQNQRAIAIKVHSSTEKSPLYTTAAGVALEGSFSVDISSSLHLPYDERRVLVSMFFGHSSIEVKAQPANLVGTGKGTEMLPVKFDWA
jgi:molecular chaperone DnaK (HSP70)